MLVGKLLPLPNDIVKTLAANVYVYPLNVPIPEDGIDDGLTIIIGEFPNTALG
jgi:hypothetical protein